MDNITLPGILQKGITLVDFWAPWCMPCRTQIPILHELENELRNESFNVVKVNIEEDMDTATQLSIRAIPALFLYKDGKIVERFSGVQPKAQLLNSIKSHLETQ